MTHPGEKIQSYVLLGGSDGSKNHDIHSRSLSTYECLEFLIELQQEYPQHIKVGFFFSYDVAMISRDLTPKQMTSLALGDTVFFCGYRIKWLKGKFLEIWQGKKYTKIFDSQSFFNTSFINACNSYLADDPEWLALWEDVAYGKGERSDFQYEELETLIRPYMHKELILLAKLMDRLRGYLASIDVHPTSWHGTGAIADALLIKHRIHEHRPAVENEFLAAAAQYAYHGGRFEQFKCGLFYGDVYNYDINSAYPYALTQIPSLTNEYKVSENPDDIEDFSLCQIRYLNPGMPRTGINPLPFRSSAGGIYYPDKVKTWAWGIEAKTALKWFPQQIDILKVVTFEDSGVRPFDFLNDLFAERRKFQKEENPVQLACKLGMNSIYGKLAQRVGHKDGKAPKHHQLRMAGYCTALCRSYMLDAMMQAPEAIIAVETDGIYSEKPLTLNIGKELGQYGESHYDGILFIQSGVYFTNDDGDWSIGKTRGFGKNKTNINNALSSVPNLHRLEISNKRFHGLPGAIGSPLLRSWTEEPRIIEWGGGGKRNHRPEYCQGCADGSFWHETIFTKTPTPVSAKHTLPWLEEK